MMKKMEPRLVSPAKSVAMPSSHNSAPTQHKIKSHLDFSLRSTGADG